MNRKQERTAVGLATAIVLAAAGFIVAEQLSYASTIENRAQSDYIERNAKRETGAENLVTSIYLGYRAFDTLGETIVLLLVVSGSIAFIGRYESDTSYREREDRDAKD